MATLVELSSDSELLGQYDRLDVASVAARQLIRATGVPVTVRVYDVTDTAKALTRKFRMLRDLEGGVIVST